MKQYFYQMHTHTTPCSLCSRMEPRELVESLRSGGYQGCVITNHFRGGNTGVSRRLPWADFVAAFEQDYLAIRDCAREYDLDILFGIEEGVGGGLEILLYGLTPQMLYDHPELAGAGIEVWYETLHPLGVLCIQAHPLRDRDYVAKPMVLPLRYIDGIEVYNGGNTRKNDLDAEAFAAAHPELILLSGADTHDGFSVCWGGIACEKRIRNEKELVQVLRSGAYSLLRR